MTERWRCFIAAPIGEVLRSILTESRNAWLQRPDLASLRWIDPARWHLTLAFLGDVEGEAVPGIVERTSDVARRHVPVRVPTGGLGAFRSARVARVAWYGIGDPDGRLSELARHLAVALELKAADAYRPHLTLARAREAPVDLRAWIRDAGDAVPRATLEVDRLHVMRSHRRSGTVDHETLAVLPLEGLPS